jgi:hypothetical protein
MMTIPSGQIVPAFSWEARFATSIGKFGSSGNRFDVNESKEI